MLVESYKIVSFIDRQIDESPSYCQISFLSKWRQIYEIFSDVFSTIERSSLYQSPLERTILRCMNFNWTKAWLPNSQNSA